MSATISTTSAGVLSGGTTRPRDGETDETASQFLQYMNAMQAAKLSRVQLQQLQKTSADEERAKTLDRIEEQNEKQSEEYNKRKGNGYTVGEIRRGRDQWDNALKRQTRENAANSTERRAAQSSQTLQNSRRQNISGDFAETSGKSETSNTPTNADNASYSPNTASAESSQEILSGNSATETQQQISGSLPANNAARSSQSSDAADITQNISSAAEQKTNHLSNRQSGNSVRGEIATSEKAIRHLRNAVNHHAANSGKNETVSLAATTLAKPSALKKSASKDLADSEQEIAAARHSTDGISAKERPQGIITQEALTAVSGTRQAANDTVLQSENAAQREPRETPQQQTAPTTSLWDRIDHRQLTNRVASVFRSFANQGGTIRMKLHPEELGALTIRMQIDSGKVAAKLEAENETARRALLANVESLKQKLKEQRLEVTSFEIGIQPKTEKQQTSELRKNKDNSALTPTKTILPLRQRASEKERMDVYR
ncbi:MAG: flagellar hook-length control protein FliK [Planctomycetaceae bacterium]|jgi:flagellar hook-length control protein FliK|nr:flagellar hook-length control protein FliK [Planctomycetaceae bacterium]